MRCVRRLRFLVAGTVFLAALWMGAALAWADVPKVTIQVPSDVRAGQPFSITLQIRHVGNNFIHHVSKLALYVDGREAKAWEYGWRGYPKEENWSMTHELSLNQNATVSAVATCNLHGPSKEATLAISPSGTR